MIHVTIAAHDMQRLRDELLSSESERCAVLLAMPAKGRDENSRLLVREIIFPEQEEYLSASDTHATLAPSFVAKVTKVAKQQNVSLVFVHSHVGTLPPAFSPIDDAGERELAAFLAHRHPEQEHLALVISAGGACIRQLGREKPAQLVSIGERRSVLFRPSEKREPTATAYDRQIRAFGQAGQEVIRELQVAIVGLGGTGSIVAQELAHLGVRHFVLVDPDVIESTNLNRVVGASEADVGVAKVEVAARLIKQINPHANCVLVSENLVRVRTASRITAVDIIFGCTDSHGSRAMLQQISYQYLIPCIDMGTTIVAKHGEVRGIYGRVQLLSPGIACFFCGGLLDSEQIRRDMMSDGERKLDPYIQGANEPAPAVISINGVVASLAVTMFLAIVTDIPSNGRHLVYNGKVPKLQAVATTPIDGCFICSREGVFALGDSTGLFGRLD